MISFIQFLTEQRSNPDNNPRFSTIEHLAKYQGKEQDLYISFTFEDKIGINPKSSEKNGTPSGIYTYQLDYALPQILTEKGLFGLPYLGRIPPRYVWIIKPKTKVMVLNDYNNFESDVDKLKRHFANNKFKSQSIDWYLQQIEDNGWSGWRQPFKLWKLTQHITERDHRLWSVNQNTNWNAVLRKVLDYPIIRDDGLGVIHYHEKTQTVFLSSSTFSVVDKIIMERYKYRKPKKPPINISK
jgi:hypothetical protein